MAEENATAKSEKSGPQWRVPSWFPELNAQTLEKLKLFHVELQRFNTTINLISSGTVNRADQVHFADCILASQFVLKATQQVEIVDLGSGNGFPGLVLGILDPGRRVVLLDSDTRKVEFLKSTIHALGLSNVNTLLKRYEELPANSIKCAVMRGLTNIPKALVSLRKQFPVGGELFHLKGSEWAIEVASIPTQVCSMWNTEPVGEYVLPETDEGRIVIVSKRFEG